MLDWLFDGINSVIQALGNVGQAIIDFLPTSPLQWTANIDSEILAWINWMIPFGEIIVIGQMWLLGIAIWYVVRIALNWIKVTGG